MDKNLHDELERVANKIIENSTQQPPEIAKAVEENFWDLFGDNGYDNPNENEE